MPDGPANGALDERSVDSSPIQQFRRWYQAAFDAGVPQPEAMALATAQPDGQPSARMVILRGVDERGFVFYTDLASPKARDLAANARAALVLYWPLQRRQIRVEGSVEPLPEAEIEAFFQSRPRDAQLALWLGRQSDVVAGREVLERRLAEETERHRDRPVPRPPGWGGYRLVPTSLEFWQEDPRRLHDRLRYRRSRGQWVLERLTP